jgi:hypothetical protein
MDGMHDQTRIAITATVASRYLHRVCDVTGLPRGSLMSDFALSEVTAMWAIVKPYARAIDGVVYPDGRRVNMASIMWWCAPRLEHLRNESETDLIYGFLEWEYQHRYEATSNVPAWAAAYVCLCEMCGEHVPLVNTSQWVALRSAVRFAEQA